MNCNAFEECLQTIERMFWLQADHVGALISANCVPHSGVSFENCKRMTSGHSGCDGYKNAPMLRATMPTRLGSLNPIFRKISLPRGVEKSRVLSSRFVALNQSPSNNKIIGLVQNRVEELNQYYERVTGIADIREIQNKVIGAEQEFVEISQQRKSCQDQIDTLKNSVRSLKDKLDTTSPTSDSYLELRKYEYDLSRELLALDAQLARLKEREQLSFDGLSKLLRQNHEQERLRQERAKHWQVISIALSAVVSLVALIAQRIRSQTLVVKRLDSVEASLQEVMHLKETVDNLTTTLDRIRLTSETLLKAVIKIQSSMESQVNDHRSKKTSDNRGWSSYVPGITLISALFRYIY